MVEDPTVFNKITASPIPYNHKTENGIIDMHHIFSKLLKLYKIQYIYINS
jgi:hypothetical protein